MNIKDKKVLIVTIASDKSLSCFNDVPLKLIDIVYIKDYFDKELSKEYDLVYIRDIFVEEYNLEYIKTVIEDLHCRYSKSYFIDNIRELKDLLIEGKWIQYKKFSDFMPFTKLASSLEKVSLGEVAKKRISSRGRGVYVGPNDALELGEYIVQKMLKIDVEYRVYVVFNKINKKVAIKSSQTLLKKVKVQNAVDIPEDVKIFSELIIKKIPDIDFCGLDIARVGEKLYLIEVNRAPQFKKFRLLTGINLAEELLD